VAARENKQRGHAGEEEHRDEHEQQGKRPRRPASCRQRPHEQATPHSVPAARRQLNLRAGQAGQLRDADEPKASRPEAGYKPLDRGDGLRTVPPAVVHENDAAGLPFWRRRPHDRCHTWSAPVLAVEVREDHQVAARGKIAERARLACGQSRWD
jgi:hypothetical protein